MIHFYKKSLFTEIFFLWKNLWFYVLLDDSAENALGNKCESDENITEDYIDNPIDDVIDNTVTVETLPDLASLFVTPAVRAVMFPKEKCDKDRLS